MKLPPPTSSPCNACPWRREAAPGWLGPYDAQQWVSLAGSDQPIACHKTILRDGDWDGAKQCAGAAAYRANSFKSPRDPEVACGPKRDDVFKTSTEFMEHHTI